MYGEYGFSDRKRSRDERYPPSRRGGYDDYDFYDPRDDWGRQPYDYQRDGGGYDGGYVTYTPEDRQRSRSYSSKAPKPGTVLCHVHNKYRTLVNMFEEEAGRFRCRAGMPCKGTAGPTDQQVNGGTCPPASSGSAPSSASASASGSGSGSDRPRPCMCLSISYVHGTMGEGGETRAPIAAAAMFVCNREEIMIFNGRIKAEGMQVTSDEFSRVGMESEADLSQGVDISTVKQIVSAFLHQRGTQMVGYETTNDLFALGFSHVQATKNNYIINLSTKFEPSTPIDEGFTRTFPDQQLPAESQGKLSDPATLAARARMLRSLHEHEKL